MTRLLSRAIVAALIFTNLSFAEQAERQDLGLEGCPVSGVAGASSVAFVLAACEAPRGLYYSLDFGTTWNFANGGAYEAGTGQEVQVTTNYAFAKVNNVTYRAALPSNGATTWTPSWEELSGVSLNLLRASGAFLVAVKDGNAVASLNESGAELSSSSLSNVEALAVANTSIYALVSDSSLPSTASRKLLKTTFNSSTGAIGSTWSNISSATGLPTSVQFWNVIATADDSAVYVGTRDYNTPNGNFAYTDALYRSGDSGTSFSNTGKALVPNSGCFSGTSHIIGTAYSTDGGTTWNDVDGSGGGSSSTTNRSEDKGCFFDPSLSTRALVSSNQGFRVVSNIGGTLAYGNANDGFESVLVKAMHTASDNPDRVMLGTSSGVAFSDNFTSTTPIWLYPICPGNDCVGGDKVLINPSNSNELFYASGNIRKGTVSGSGESASISWSNYADKPSDAFQITSMNIYSFAPTTLYMSYARTEGAVDGGIYTYDLTTNPATGVALAGLQGEPVASFKAISSSVMFATLAEGSSAPGLYRSQDGGVTFTLMSDSDLPSALSINAFAYDSVRDLLYAASRQTESDEQNVFVLKKAASGGTNWTKAAEGMPLPEGGSAGSDGVKTVSVNEDTGVAFAAGGQYIWASTDQGLTWSLYYTDLEGAATNVVDAASATDTSGARSYGGFGLDAVSTRQVVAGGNTGFSALGGAVVASCKLAKVKVKKNKSSATPKVLVTISDAILASGIGGVQFQLQQKKGKSFKTIKRSKTNSKGKKKLSLKTKKGKQIFRIVTTDPACTSKLLKVKNK